MSGRVWYGEPSGKVRFAGTPNFCRTEAMSGISTGSVLYAFFFEVQCISCLPWVWRKRPHRWAGGDVVEGDFIAGGHGDCEWPRDAS
jgi:hypothetical protein